MEVSFNCPCCQANNWCTVKEYHYENRTNKNFGNTRTNYNTNFLNIRQQILFDVWFPGQKKVVLTSIYCNICGFMCYSPRPNEDDMKAKYQFLSKRGNIGILSNPTPRALKLDRRRELFMNKVIAKHHTVESQKVLDVGGGDGRLLRPFLEKGCSCYLVDTRRPARPSSGDCLRGRLIHRVEIARLEILDAVRVFTRANAGRLVERTPHASGTPRSLPGRCKPRRAQ